MTDPSRIETHHAWKTPGCEGALPDHNYLWVRNGHAIKVRLVLRQPAVVLRFGFDVLI
jgi:hypothetical protein